MADDSLFCNALCTQPPSPYCAWRNIKSAYNKDMLFKSKEMSCKHHLHLYFWSDRRFHSRPPPYWATCRTRKTESLSHKMWLTWIRSCRTVVEQPCLGATLTNKFAGWNPPAGHIYRSVWVHSPFELTQLLLKLQMELLMLFRFRGLWFNLYR